MAQTVLEISAKTSNTRNTDNSSFTQIFGEPIKCAAGSSIDFLNGFLDLGTQSTDDYINIPAKFQLGINFYRYEYDHPQIPTTQGTDSAPHSKRYIYWFPQSPDIPDPFNQSSLIDAPGYSGQPLPPTTTQYGSKISMYSNSNLPAFLQERQSQTTETLPDNSKMRVDTFNVIEETATIDIPAGYYSKVKLCQIVNDAFNLFQGSLVNSDKPLETSTASTQPIYINDVAPYDYQNTPNAITPLLRAFEYPYSQAKVSGADPDSISSETKIYINDLTWPYWFIPVFTVPNDLTYFVNENIYPPYVWYNDEQTGFLSGTSKFNLNYDTANDVFFIDYCHTPIVDTEQREVVLFSKSLMHYSNDADASNVGYKANSTMGGIIISRLFSYDYDSTGAAIPVNTGFWQKQLGFGFDDAYQTQFKADMITQDRTFYNNYRANDPTGAYGITYKFVFTYPDPKYLGTSTTAALIPIQWLQQSNFATAVSDKGMSIFSRDIPKIFQSIGSRSIFGDDINSFTKPDAYYLVSINISHLKNSNYRDRDTYRQIMTIAGKTYSSGTNYIQLFSDSSITALNLTEDIYIDKIEIEILRPDKTLALGLGDDSSIFIRLTQPVQVP